MSSSCANSHAPNTISLNVAYAKPSANNVYGEDRNRDYFHQKQIRLAFLRQVANRLENDTPLGRLHFGSEGKEGFCGLVDLLVDELSVGVKFPEPFSRENRECGNTVPIGKKWKGRKKT